jgi:glycosyltransferase involved in cell wall biosynthesis
MNCGVPVIGSAVGGMPEVITHGETGYLFPVGDIAAMAAHAVALLNDPARLELFSTQAKRRAEQNFNADEIIPRYEAFYEEILKS